ncbi:uncharacterized protein At5g39865-like [Mangifera indica]|uniref:uncharacterized protein At5g39865-like n=1 Tax=Mangifera indica TaxID=29780 RepID=UPI001CF9AD5B|nr:uncharacterized protein At5g39865-like [Mangifera indica]
MWPEWLRSPTASPSRVHPRSKSFSCSSFKDIPSILKEPESEPRSPKSPSVFHRVRISTSVLRSWANKNSIPSSNPSFRPPHKGIIIFFTSLRVVRKTYEDCRTVRSILRAYRVPIDERDLSMDSKFLDELQGIMGCNAQNLTLPKVFIGGRHIGGAEEIKRLNESGDLKHIINKLQLVGPTFCDQCVGIRFVLCEECNGSHKIYVEKCGFRTCKSCNINGLIMCPSCCPVLR